MAGQALNRFFSAVLFGERPASAARAESRTLGRYPVRGRVSVQWSDAGGHKAARARGVNMSEGGAMIETGAAIESGTAVWLDFSELQLNGTARVRHCTRKGRGYLVGLCFTGPLFRRFA